MTIKMPNKKTAIKLFTFIFALALLLGLNDNIAMAKKGHSNGDASAGDGTGKYVMDTAKAHAFIEFKVSHLGYSWLLGRFDTFEGEFEYDATDPSRSEVEVEIDTASVNSNHSERDKHLRSEDFLFVDKFPEAKFESTSYDVKDGKGVVKGKFTLRGVTRDMEIAVTEIGHGPDPWGGYRMGFEGTTSFKMKDYGILKELGPASQTVHIYISFEGVKKK